MTLTYKEKLTLFHDTFVEYLLHYISHQETMELNQEIHTKPTVLTLDILLQTVNQVINYQEDSAVQVAVWQNDRLANKIKEFFSNSKRVVKQILSASILEIAVYMEPNLIKLEETQDIINLSTKVLLKLIMHLRNAENSEISHLKSKNIVDIILSHRDKLDNDYYLRETLVDSENYKFITESDFETYININRHRPIFSEFIREKYELSSDTQIVFSGKKKIIVGCGKSYYWMNGYNFNSQIPLEKEELNNKLADKEKFFEIIGRIKLYQYFDIGDLRTFYSKFDYLAEYYPESINIDTLLAMLGNKKKYIKSFILGAFETIVERNSDFLFHLLNNLNSGDIEFVEKTSAIALGVTTNYDIEY